jgi:hypothetical protein
VTETNKAKAYIGMAMALQEAIQHLGEVPSGHLYARLMGSIDLDTYNGLLDILKEAGVIKVSSSHLITWVGRTAR